MNRRDDIFGYLLPLDPGTNAIVLIATDATTNNLSSKLLVVERTDRYQASITSPNMGTFANGTTQTVTLVVSSLKDADTDSETGLVSVAVNGVTATLVTNSDGLFTFRSEE